MSTTSTINIITGRTGTAHVSSADDAAIYRGIVGSDKVTLSTDQQLALDYSTKESLVVSDGVFCIGGRMGRISNTASVDYSCPTDINKYRRTILLVRYAYNSSSDTESMTLMTLQSESDAGSVEEAAVLPITINNTTDYVLYDFVCDEDGVVSGSLKTKFTVMNTIKEAAEAAEEAKVKEYTGEKTATDTGRVYFTFNESASTILTSSYISVVKLWKHDGNGIDSAICIWIKSSNLESVWRTNPVLMTVNNSQMLVVFNLSIITSGTYSGKLACSCATTSNGSYVVTPANIPFDRASIFSWS